MKNVEDYINTCINEYPTLYADKDYKTSEMKVLDQLFNVNGNGFRDDEELLEEMKRIDKPGYPKYIGKDLFYGYSKVRSVGDGNVMPVGDSVGVYSEREKEDHPEIKHWVYNNVYPFKPYPNFQEEYSTIYQCPIFLTFDNEWIEKAIEYYEYCLKWFENNESKYHGAFPCENKTRKMISDYEEFFNEYASNEEISKAYGCEFNGDIHDFATRRWNKSKEKIFKFIESTIKLLKNNIKA